MCVEGQPPPAFYFPKTKEAVVTARSHTRLEVGPKAPFNPLFPFPKEGSSEQNTKAREGRAFL